MWPFSSTAKDEPGKDLIQTFPERRQDEAITQATQLPSTSPPVPVDTKDDRPPPPPLMGYHDERLGMPFVVRFPVLLIGGFVFGFSLGGAKGSIRYADRFRAENAHRLPTTQSGWYLYQKTKNYHAGLGGIKQGVKFGGTCAGWAGLFTITEEVLDTSRGYFFARPEENFNPGHRDVANTVIAALTLAGTYSWRMGLDKFAAARTAKMALKYSLLYGFMQDAASTVQGRRPAYVNWISTKVFGRVNETKVLDPL